MLTHKLLHSYTQIQPFPPLLGLLHPEDVGTNFLETPGTLHTTQCNIPEDFYLHQHICGRNLK